MRKPPLNTCRCRPARNSCWGRKFRALHLQSRFNAAIHDESCHFHLAPGPPAAVPPPHPTLLPPPGATQRQAGDSPGARPAHSFAAPSSRATVKQVPSSPRYLGAALLGCSCSFTFAVSAWGRIMMDLQHQNAAALLGCSCSCSFTFAVSAWGVGTTELNDQFQQQHNAAALLGCSCAFGLQLVLLGCSCSATLAVSGAGHGGRSADVGA